MAPCGVVLCGVTWRGVVAWRGVVVRRGAKACLQSSALCYEALHSHPQKGRMASAVPIAPAIGVGEQRRLEIPYFHKYLRATTYLGY